MKDFWKRKRNKRIAASALAVVMAGFLVWGLFPWQAAAAGTTVADDVTINKWHDPEALDDSTKNVGRIWTDKSVSKGNIVLMKSEEDSKTITKNKDSDFLVGLSALSSTAKIMGQTTVPLDIVLVLDVSGSMDDQGKMTTLKNAVNNFIDKSAEENENKPANKQNRISLVKFSGNKTDKEGDETYRSGGFTFNYTQIVSNYKAYTRGNKSELKNKVNALKPAGATAADYAMDHAKTLVDRSKADETASSDRKNVKRIVIFFTDGEPNHNSGFDDDVADDAIKAAKTIKEDASIYTIGVFNDADASITGRTGKRWTNKEKFNAYMHGMSSNYPNATAYDSLGTRAKDSKGNNTQFYKAATDAGDLNSIFTEIRDEIISSAQSPTQVEQGEKPHQSGYITFTDQLGDYMQVDDMNTLLYADQMLTSKTQGYSRTETTAGNKTTVKYTFDYDIPETNHVYPEGNLKDIVITVEKATGDDQLNVGDLVTVKIPANLIPLRYYEIDKDGNMTIDETVPMRLFYDVSLKDGVAEKIENPDALLQAYIDANKDDEGHVHFYSNKYDKKLKDEASEGIGAYAHFVPATTNDFYYFQNDTFLYKDEACTKPATGTIDTSGNYYYQRDYYKLENGETKKEKNTVTIPGNSNIIREGYVEKKDGQYYIPAGKPRTTSLSYFTENKAEGANKTGTAHKSIKPVWKNDFSGESVNVYLGNNGRMTFDLPGQLDISKTVKAETGHAVPESLENKEFEYKLELTAKEGSKLKAEYTAQKYNGAKADGDSIKIKPGDIFTLKDGQTLKIYGLAPGTEYTVTETKADHFTAAVTQDNAGDNAKTGNDNNGGVFAKGTIPGNDVASAAFTNKYKADPATLDGSANLKLKKDFVTANGKSAWNMDYLKDAEFTFYLVGDGSDMPMPEGSTTTAAGKTAVVQVNSADDINKAFGDIKYTEPGTYRYRLVEKEPAADGKLGVSYSYAAYTVTVTVTDKDGTLNAEAVMKQVRDDNGDDPKNAVIINDNTAVFRNVYDADSAHVDVAAEKSFTDYTGSRQLENGEYTFRLTAKGGAPLPGGTSRPGGESYIETTNTGIGVVFGNVTVTAEDAHGATKDSPKSYEYTMEEVLPEGATAKNHYTVNGVTYDPAKYTVRFNVYIDKVNDKNTVIVDRTYLDDDDKEITTGVPVFNNSYKATPVALTGDTALKGEKTLTGRDMLSGETFDFTLTAGDDSTTKALEDKVVTIAENGDKASVGRTNDKDRSFKFGNVTFKKEGTYTFDIEETVPDQIAGGMTYDRHTATATVVVTDDGNGHLKAAVSYDNGTVSDASDRAVFENKYEASHAYSTSGGLNVEKVLNGRTMKQGEFGFTIEAQGDAPAVSKDDAAFTNPKQRASGEADSMQKLLGLRFDQDDAGKTFTYLVKEDKGSAKGVTYDETRFLVAIKVMDKGDGTLYTITTITPQTKGDDGTYTNGTAKEFNSATDPDNKPALRFTNTYEAGEAAPVSVTDGFSKELTGRDWRDSDKFIFTIANIQKPDGVETAPMPAETDVIVTKADLAQNGKAPFDFGSITFTKAGVYKYKVTEQQPVQAGENTIGMNYDLTPRIITVTVTDDGTGQLKAAVTAVENSKTFTNKYVTEDLPLDTACGIKVTKVLYGHDMADGQFEFSLKAKDKASADKLRIDKDNGATFTSTAAAAGETATLLDSLQMIMTQSDIDKTYSYTFAEKQGNAAGYTYDDNTYRLDITTHDAGDGTLTAIVVLTNTKTGTEVSNKTVSAAEPALGEKGITIPFVNRYKGSTDVSGGTKAAISADKTLNGRKLKAGEFSFTLATRSSTGSASNLETKTNDANGNIAFSALSYRTSDNAAGNGTILSEAVRDKYATKSTNDQGQAVYTLNYRVYENTGSLPAGVTGGTTSFDFTVTVTDNGNGTLTAVTNYPDGKSKFGFVNQYGTDNVDVNVTGSKTLYRAEGLNPNDITGKFNFTLEAMTPGAPMPDNTTAKNDAAGNVDFGKTTFKFSDLEDVTPAADGSRSKTFEYKVTESGSAAGVTNDTNKTKPFQITLKDDGKGKLTATCNPKEGPKFTFTNTYTVGELPSSITDQIKIDKNLTGRDLKEGEFTFELLEDGQVVATGSNDASGNVTFNKIKYAEPGQHTYTVREVNNDLGGVTYDDQLYTVHTTITDNRDGTMNAKHKAFAVIDGKELAPVDEITFTNKYEAKGTMASIGAVKRLTGKDLKDGQFTFQLKDENGKVIDEAKNDKAGAISFKALEFDKAGTYKYTISEVNDKQKEIKYDTSEKTVTITVKDSGDGYLQAQVESEKQLIFTNTFEAAGGSGTKTGDNMNLVLPIMMMLTAAAIGSVLLIRRKYHR